jgi:transcriptional regulator with XRE-family HTH domain
MNKIFAQNLKNLRAAIPGLTQQRAAQMIGVTRGAYGAWEEGRAFPSVEKLVQLASVFAIADLLSFISDESFDFGRQAGKPEPKPKLHQLTAVQRAYEKAHIKDKLCVNILLNLVDVDDPS